MAHEAAAAALVLAAVALAGCSGTDEAGSPTASSSPGTPGSQTTISRSGPPSADDMVLSGAVRALGQGFAANVSAYNNGTEPYGYSRKFYDSNYQYAWRASLSGPPGTDLDYAAPSQSRDSSTHANGAGYTRAPMPPGSYVNWTYGGPHETGECRVLPDCSNWWDGNLTLDGSRVPAPAGNYTWRFTFTYRVPETVDSDWDTSRRQEHLDFQVQVPADA